jgi:hypothetical protein
MYRIFIDEVGTHDMKSCDVATERYLGLTGVIMRLAYEQDEFTSCISALKMACFGTQNIVLHRRDIVNKTTPFEALLNPAIQVQFDSELMKLPAESPYRVFTAVLDKKEHAVRYRVWRFHPYHYCLTVTLERYVQWLERTHTVGDVMAESRGKKENMQLEAAYRYLYKNGTDHVPANVFQQRLSSKELKLQPKSANVAGLQLVDLIANPSCRGLICSKTQQAMTAPFGKMVLAVLNKNKYLKSPFGGRIEVGN